MKYKFECPLTSIPVTLVIGDKIQIQKMVSDKIEKNCHDAEVCTLMDDEDIVKGILVWVEDKDSFYSMIHETVHLVRQIFEITGMPFTSDNDEVIAYYQNYWVRKFWNKMSGPKKKR